LDIGGDFFSWGGEREEKLKPVTPHLTKTFLQKKKFSKGDGPRSELRKKPIVLKKRPLTGKKMVSVYLACKRERLNEKRLAPSSLIISEEEILKKLNQRRGHNRTAHAGKRLGKSLRKKTPARAHEEKELPVQGASFPKKTPFLRGVLYLPGVKVEVKT